MLLKLAVAALLIALITLGFDATLVVRMGTGLPTGGDGPYYIGLARSLASGHGYRLENSFWPDKPNISRPPLWPSILALPAFVFPNANDYVILQFTGTVLHGIAAVLMLLLAYQVTGSFGGGIIAAALLGLYPPASALVFGGYSEIAFLVVFLAGLTLAFENRRWAYAGLLLAGTGVLARSNYLLLPFVLIALMMCLDLKSVLAPRNLCQWLLGCLLFCLPGFLWIARNYAVSGYFPILSAMEGETLYGGNNSLVANDLSVWGYWVLPNEIPGEQSKYELASARSEPEVNRYYHYRAIEFIRANWFALPRLLTGKLVRGFVPVPWVPLTASYVAFFARACVYAAFAVSWFLWRDRNPAYTRLLGAMFLVTLATTLIYYGTFRFTFCLEPFLFPFIAGGAAALRKRRSAVTAT